MYNLSPIIPLGVCLSPDDPQINQFQAAVLDDTDTTSVQWDSLVELFQDQGYEDTAMCLLASITVLNAMRSAIYTRLCDDTPQSPEEPSPLCTPLGTPQPQTAHPQKAAPGKEPKKKSRVKETPSDKVPPKRAQLVEGPPSGTPADSAPPKGPQSAEGSGEGSHTQEG